MARVSVVWPVPLLIPTKSPAMAVALAAAPARSEAVMVINPLWFGLA